MQYKREGGRERQREHIQLGQCSTLGLARLTVIFHYPINLLLVSSCQPSKTSAHSVRALASLLQKCNVRSTKSQSLDESEYRMDAKINWFQLVWRLVHSLSRWPTEITMNGCALLRQRKIETRARGSRAGPAHSYNSQHQSTAPSPSSCLSLLN